MKSKRIFDLFFTVPGIIVLMPLFIVIAIWIKLDSPGPIFFRQERAGQFERKIRIFKFRTMVNNAEKLGTQITVGNDIRITRSGYFLRKYKLDELPQLFNVIKGEMNLVGPRPEVPRYVKLYDDKQRAVLNLVPGITDPASIKYRNESEILALSKDPEQTYILEILPEKILINLNYSSKSTIFSDFMIILRTILFCKHRGKITFYLRIKRCIDFILSIIGFIVLSPLFLALAIVIKIDSRGSVLFKQTRIGINKSYFIMLKFRTMKTNAPKDLPTHLLIYPDQYITKIGVFLRKTSLDELPQLFNIVKGDMSIIGPRPALWNQYDLIEERDRYGANDIRPGLTGWAQINGRDELTIEMKARFDGKYVKHMSFMFDVQIFFKTIFSVFRYKGFQEGMEATCSIDENENSNL